MEKKKSAKKCGSMFVAATRSLTMLTYTLSLVLFSVSFAAVAVAAAPELTVHGGIAEIPLHCPPDGVFGYPHPKACDQYFQCTNGTLTHEFCPNGLLYSDNGHVVGMCAYYWNVNCGEKTIPAPISSPGCPYQFGFFAENDAHQCNVFYSECSWGVPTRRQCDPHGLFYDERIKGCNWPDQLGCSSESLLGFRCPEEDKANIYYPYPRYYYDQKSIISCVSGQPRQIHCGEDEIADANSLTCQAVHKDEPKVLVAQPAHIPVRPKFRRVLH